MRFETGEWSKGFGACRVRQGKGLQNNNKSQVIQLDLPFSRKAHQQEHVRNNSTCNNKNY